LGELARIRQNNFSSKQIKAGFYGLGSMLPNHPVKLAVTGIVVIFYFAIRIKIFPSFCSQLSQQFNNNGFDVISVESKQVMI